MFSADRSKNIYISTLAIYLAATTISGCTSATLSKNIDLAKSKIAIAKDKVTGTETSSAQSNDNKEVDFSETTKDTAVASIANITTPALHPSSAICRKVKSDRDYNIADRKLWESVRGNKIEGIRQAIELGANVDHVVCRLSTSHLDIETFKLLFSNGLHVERRCFLAHAFKRTVSLSPDEQLGKVKYLINEGADLDCTHGVEPERATPLIHSATGFLGNMKEGIKPQEKEMLRLILAAGADKHINSYAQQLRSLHGYVNSVEKHKEMIDIFLKFGMNPNIQEFLEKGVPRGATILERAAREAKSSSESDIRTANRLKLVKYYVSRGADLNHLYANNKKKGTFIDFLPNDYSYNADFYLEMMKIGARFHLKPENNI